MKKIYIQLKFAVCLFLLASCSNTESGSEYFTISKTDLENKIKGAWAAQTIGVSYGGPTEFKFNKRIIPDSVEISWTDSTLMNLMTNSPGLYDDIYMDLTFVEVMEKEGIEAPASSHAKAFAEAGYVLWHANQQGRNNYLNGIKPPESGHWINNPHADDIDFQIEADFAGIMSPGMPNTALEICDRVGHTMNSGDGYYGGVFVAGMYTAAFIQNDIPSIVSKGLDLIPAESQFFQCITDVINWHKAYPDDWKKNWELIEEKWGVDIGCPVGVNRNFNIDAKLNAAYVVLGLLYGEGDFTKTFEISTRAGQDSDCNPATAGAILGTIYGYEAIPEYWKQGLIEIEDMDFKYTSTSLNDVYRLSLKHALELVEKNGGKVTETEVKIKLQEAVPAPLEVNFPGYEIGEITPVNKQIAFKDSQTYEIKFEGIGVVLEGKVHNLDYKDKNSLDSEEETLGDYIVEVDFILDGQLSKTMKLPLSYLTRHQELFFQYELQPGTHTLGLHIKNPHEKVFLEMGRLLTYQKNE